MTDTEISELLAAAVRQALPERSEDFQSLDLEADFRDLGVTSIIAMDIIGYVEDGLARTFRREELQGIRRLGDIAQLIRQHDA